MSQGNFSETYKKLATMPEQLQQRITNGCTAFYNVISQELSEQEFTKESIEEYILPITNTIMTITRKRMNLRLLLKHLTSLASLRMLDCKEKRER